MDRELSLEELETEHATELPERETLWFFSGTNIAGVTAINTAVAVNAVTWGSAAFAIAGQSVKVVQVNN